MNLGGLLPTIHGLRFVAPNASSLGYSSALIEIQSDMGLWPRSIRESDAQEFRTMTSGIEIYIRLPKVINPAVPSASSRMFYRGSFARFAQTAHLLRARAIIMDPGYRVANGKPVTPGDVLDRIEDFFQGLDEFPAGVHFLTREVGCGSPVFLERLVERLGSRFSIALDPAQLPDGIDLTREAHLDAYVRRWGAITRSLHLGEVGDAQRGLLRRLGDRPTFLTMPSALNQVRAASRARALRAEPDLVGTLRNHK